MFTVWENHDAKHAYLVIFAAGDTKAAMPRQSLILSTEPKTDEQIASHCRNLYSSYGPVKSIRRADVPSYAK